VVTAVVDARRVVSVPELQRAWRAVQAGKFRQESPTAAAQAPAIPGPPIWAPGTAEQVLPVVGCAGASGASTMALALASAAESSARVLECRSGITSGLAAASTAELGLHPSGWRRGMRGDVLLERANGHLTRVDEVPLPSQPDRPIAVTALDVGWDLRHVLDLPCWMAEQVRTAGVVVVVTRATIPGLLHLETTLSLLGDVRAIAAMLASPNRRWSKAVRQSAGPLTEALQDSGRVIVIPHDSRLAAVGLDSRPLPRQLLEAARAILELAGSAMRQAR
jgi:hypothetical protein